MQSIYFLSTLLYCSQTPTHGIQACTSPFHHYSLHSLPCPSAQALHSANNGLISIRPLKEQRNRGDLHLSLLPFTSTCCGCNLRSNKRICHCKCAAPGLRNVSVVAQKGRGVWPEADLALVASGLTPQSCTTDSLCSGTVA
jgi:hypothetical protein